MSDGKTRTPMSQKEWLAFEDGVNWERARVVKLLEGEKERSGQALDGIVEVWAGLKLAIALIKGEK